MANRVFQMQRINSFGGQQQQATFIRDRRNIFSDTIHSQLQPEPYPDASRTRKSKSRKRYWTIFGKYRTRNSSQLQSSAKLLASTKGEGGGGRGGSTSKPVQQKVTIGVQATNTNATPPPSFMSFQPILSPPPQHGPELQLMKLELEGYRRCEKISRQSEQLYTKLVDKIKKNTQRQINRSRKDKENAIGQSTFQPQLYHVPRDHTSSKPQLYEFDSHHKYHNQMQMQMQNHNRMHSSIGRESYIEREEHSKDRNAKKEARQVQSTYQQALSPFTLHEPISPQQQINQRYKKSSIRHSNQIGEMNRMIEMYGWRWKRAEHRSPY